MTARPPSGQGSVTTICLDLPHLRGSANGTRRYHAHSYIHAACRGQLESTPPSAHCSRIVFAPAQIASSSGSAAASWTASRFLRGGRHARHPTPACALRQVATTDLCEASKIWRRGRPLSLSLTRLCAHTPSITPRCAQTQCSTRHATPPAAADDGSPRSTREIPLNSGRATACLAT